MRPDVSELWEFYGSRLGQMTRARVRQQIRMLWPDVTGQEVLGLGYAVPYLSPFRSEAERVVALMPATQGVMHWPDHPGHVRTDNGGLVALAPDYELPFDDNSFDRILLTHSLEHAGRSRALLREIWRILRSGGRLLVIAPNRASPWALMERTPFGHGHPYSQSQLNRLLRDNMYQPLRHLGALYLPPWRSRLLLRAAGPVEKIGARWGMGLPGVLLVEADKQIYAGTAIPVKSQLRAAPAVASVNKPIVRHH